MILEKTHLFFVLFYTFAKELRIKNMDKLIGREKEIKQLNDYVASDRPEFIAIYGRRRVGKTFLVNQLFGGKMAFSMTGVMEGTKDEQMEAFIDAMEEFGGELIEKPKTWMEAFRKETGAKEALWPALVTTYGLANGIHSSTFIATITMDDLFK